MLDRWNNRWEHGAKKRSAVPWAPSRKTLSTIATVQKCFGRRRDGSCFLFSGRDNALGLLGPSPNQLDAMGYHACSRDSTSLQRCAITVVRVRLRLMVRLRVMVTSTLSNPLIGRRGEVQEEGVGKCPPCQAVQVGSKEA